MNSDLRVYSGTGLLGHLSQQPDGTLAFVYVESAIEGAETTMPLGLFAPRRNVVHRGVLLQNFINNLLPEGELRRRLARGLGLSEGNALALLERVGGECAGHLRFASADQAVIPPTAQRRTLTELELRNVIAVLPTHPLLAASDELRTTLPGEFDKLPATIVDGQVTLETGGALSRHILKPAKPGLRESVLNEGFVMSLAEGLGIPVAETVVLQGQVAILGSTRVDRLSETRSESPATTDVTVRAQAMEDFCQLLGFSPEQKYEREGGPRYADIAAWLREYSYAPALCLRNLVRWACFGFLCGFGAGHNKQLAVLYDKNGIRLAPFFGIWSTQVYPQMSARMGFAIGGEDRPDWLTPTRWRDFATTIGVRPAYVLGELERMADELPRLAAQTADDYQKQNGYASVLRRIRVLIEQRARQVAVSLAAEKGVRLQRKTA